MVDGFMALPVLTQSWRVLPGALRNAWTPPEDQIKLEEFVSAMPIGKP